MTLYKQTLLSQVKGYGMIATAEKPLFEIPSTLVLTEIASDISSLNEFIVEAVHKLPKEKQNAFLNLHNAHATSGTGVPILPAFFGICKTNAFSYNGRKQHGVFELCSRFNHNCIPNARHFWNQETGELEIKAISDITQGTEITIRYLSTLESEQSHQQRRKLLLHRYGFLCVCPRCDQPANISHDGLRAQVEAP